MVKNDVQSDLADGFEPGPLPAMATDGGFAPPPPAKISDPPPRLCEQGPCACYHKIEIVMDSAKPIGAELDDQGRVTGPAPDVRGNIEIHHYCYPSVGIETRLGSLPVVGCNRWDPVLATAAALEQRRQEYLKTADGQRYLGELGDWEDRQKEAIDEEVKAAEDAAAVLAEAARAREAAPPAQPVVLATGIPAIEGEPTP